MCHMTLNGQYGIPCHLFQCGLIIRSPQSMISLLHLYQTVLYIFLYIYANISAGVPWFSSENPNVMMVGEILITELGNTAGARPEWRGERRQFREYKNSLIYNLFLAENWWNLRQHKIIVAILLWHNNKNILW